MDRLYVTKAQKWIVLCFLASWNVTFSFLYRDGFLPLPGVIGTVDLSEVLIVAMILSVAVNPTTLIRDVMDILLLKMILIIVFCVTLAGYLLLKSNMLSYPYSIENRLIVQVVALIGQVVAGVLIARVVFLYPRLSFKAILIGFYIAVIGVVFQFLLFGTGSIMWRLHGIHGEPKGLALFLVPFLVAMIYVRVLSRIQHILLALVALGVVIFTYSSTGYISLFVGVVVLVLLRLIFGLENRIRVMAKMLAVVVMFSIVINLPIAGIAHGVSRIGEYMSGQGGTQNQLYVALGETTGILVEENDFPVIMYLINNLHTSILGVGFGLSTFYAYPYTSPENTSYITPNMAVLNNISNYGLLIMGFMFLSFMFVFRALLARVSLPQHRFIVYYFSASFLSSMLIYSNRLSFMLSFSFFSILLLYFKRANVNPYTIR